MSSMEIGETPEVSYNKSLFQAVVKNDAEEISRLIDLGANVKSEFTVDELMNDELLDDKAIAILTKANILAAKLLKTMPIDERTADKLKNYKYVIYLPVLVNKIILSTKSKLSALQVAVLCGCEKAVFAELIMNGSNLNKALDIQGITILQLMCTAAVFRDKSCCVFDENIIQLLFDNGADPNIEDVTGKRFLHYAVICGDFLINETVKSMKIPAIEPADHYERIKTFLINGANPNVDSKFDLCTIVYDIFEHRRYSDIQEKLINLLIDSGCLYKPCENPRVRGMLLKISPEIVQKAIRKGVASSRFKDDDFLQKYNQRVAKSTQLIDSVTKDKLPETRLLLNEGISPNTRCPLGRSLLHIAVKETNDIPLIELLLDKGADPNIKTWNGGETPLIIAVQSKNSEVVKLLLEQGANPRLLSAKGYSALYAFLVTEGAGDSLESSLISHGANKDMSREFHNLCNETNNELKTCVNIEQLETNVSRMKKIAPKVKRKVHITMERSLLDYINERARSRGGEVSRRITTLVEGILSNLP